MLVYCKCCQMCSSYSPATGVQHQQHPARRRLLSSEKNFAREGRLGIENYVIPLKFRQDLLTEGQHKQLFSAIEEVTRPWHTPMTIYVIEFRLCRNFFFATMEIYRDYSSALEFWSKIYKYLVTFFNFNRKII